MTEIQLRGPVTNSHIVLDEDLFHKMVFFYNALNKGWTIKKKQNSFVFRKQHEGKKEIFHEDYLSHFLSENFDMKELIHL